MSYIGSKRSSSLVSFDDGTIGSGVVFPALGNSAVGTVSQSSGTPTGDIIESGSNSNGEYVKFADGTLICTFVGSIAFTKLGSYQTLTASRSYAGDFVSEPATSFTNAYKTDEIDLRNYCLTNYFNQWSANGKYRVNASNETASSTSGSATIYVLAIGRWY